jgi:hypothetical protein
MVYRFFNLMGRTMQWQKADFVPVYSGGPAPDSHRLPSRLYKAPNE